MEKFAKLLDIYIIKVASKSPDAPKESIFGEWLWPDRREGIPKNIEYKESDLSKDIFNQFKKHFASTNRQGLPEQTVRIISMCMMLGWYKEIFHPPPYKILYRGIDVKSAKELSELLNISDEEINKKNSLNNFNQSLPNKNGFSTSWSFKKSITKDFSEKKNQGYAVTLTAKTKDNPYKFLAGPGGLYDIDGMSRWHLEKETVGLEPIIIDKIEWKKL